MKNMYGDWLNSIELISLKSGLKHSQAGVFITFLVISREIGYLSSTAIKLIIL